MRTLTVPVSEDKGYCIVSDHVLSGLNYRRFHVGGIARGNSGRKVYRGPLVPGPWAFAVGLASVIAANPEHGTYGEIKRNLAENKEHAVVDGDHVIFDNFEYEIAMVNGFGGMRGARGSDFINLLPVRDLAPAEGTL